MLADMMVVTLGVSMAENLVASRDHCLVVMTVVQRDESLAAHLVGYWAVEKVAKRVVLLESMKADKLVELLEKRLVASKVDLMV